MTGSRLQTQSFGPFTRGVVDRANAALDLTGALRVGRGVEYTGASRLALRHGTVVALTLKDDTRNVTEEQASASATAGTLTSLTDAGSGWAVDGFAGMTVELLTGPGAGQRAVILSNTSEQLVVAAWTAVPSLAVAPTSSTTYRIVSINTAAASVDRVCAAQPFADGAIAVAWSEGEENAYVYRLTQTMDGWIDSAGLTHAGDLEPEPIGVLWSSMTTAPVVTIAEGLGVAYIAHAFAADAAGLYWPTKTLTSVTIATLQADLAGAGNQDVYFSAVASFQQALWGVGFGSGNTAGTGYRPEMARFSPPGFGALLAADSLTIGNRVRSERERIGAIGVAGSALFLGAPYLLTRITGFGRNSWYREPLDASHGIAGPLAWASDGDWFYYWSDVGPARVSASGGIEPLWTAVQDIVDRVVNPETIVCYADHDSDQIIWAVDVGDGARVRVAYDTERGLFSASDDDFGLAIGCASVVAPVVRATGTPIVQAPPEAPPNTLALTVLGGTGAGLGWVNGDALAETEVWLRRTVEVNFTLIATVPAGVTTYTLTGLLVSTDYEAKVRHTKSGVASAFSATLAFTTNFSNQPLVAPFNLSVSVPEPFTLPTRAVAQWTNSGETGVLTEVQVAGPSGVSPPASSFGLFATAGVGQASVALSLVSGTGTYWVRIRHVRSGFQVSSYTSAVSVAITAGEG